MEIILNGRSSDGRGGGGHEDVVGKGWHSRGGKNDKKKTSKVSLTLSHHELDGGGRGGNAAAYPIILEALEQSLSLHLTFARVCNIGPVAKKNLSPQLSSPTYAADGAGLFRLPPWHFAAAF